MTFFSVSGLAILFFFLLPLLAAFILPFMSAILLLAIVGGILAWTSWWNINEAKLFFGKVVQGRQNRRVGTILEKYLFSLADYSSAYATICANSHSYRIIAHFNQGDLAWAHTARGRSVEEAIVRLDSRLASRSGRRGKTLNPDKSVDFFIGSRILSRVSSIDLLGNPSRIF